MTARNNNDRFNWDDLRYFSALVDTGTISLAATRLGVNYVTVSRRIDRLEESLKLQLFARTNEGYFLTLEGNALYKHLPPVLKIFSQIAQTVGSTDASDRTVRLSMVHSLASCIVTPNLHNLQKRYPNLTIDIDASTRNMNITKRESDIAIRLGLPETGDYISRRLSDLDYVLCGTEELVNKVKKGEDVPIISFGNEFSHLAEAQYIYNNYGIDRVAFRSNSSSIQASAAIAGLGIAMLPKYLFLRSKLVRLEQPSALRREVWLLTRTNSSQVTGIRLVIDNLVKIFADNQKLMVEE